MDIEQLKYFQTLAATEHVTQAAENLCISQPALSRSLARLEFQLGVPLFDREGRQLKLIRYGQDFLQHVNKILKEYDAAIRKIDSMIHPDSGEISLGFLHSLGSEVIPKIIASFKKQYPNVKFNIHQNSSKSLLEKLSNGQLDICLVTPMPGFSKIDFSILWKDELFLALPPTHPLAEFPSISLDRLINEPFIFQKKGMGLRDRMDVLCAEAKFTPNVAMEGEEILTVLGMVAAGLGVTFVPTISEYKSFHLNFIPLESFNAFRLVGLATKKGHYLSPAVLQFQNFVSQYLKKYPERFPIIN